MLCCVYRSLAPLWTSRRLARSVYWKLLRTLLVWSWSMAVQVSRLLIHCCVYLCGFQWRVFMCFCLIICFFSVCHFSSHLLSLLPLPLSSPLGDGKTYYIQQQLAHSPASLTVTVNEAFTPLKAISKLRTLPLDQKNCTTFFNFTMLPPGVRVYGR